MINVQPFTSVYPTYIPLPSSSSNSHDLYYYLSTAANEYDINGSVLVYGYIITYATDTRSSSPHSTSSRHQQPIYSMITRLLLGGGTLLSDWWASLFV